MSWSYHVAGDAWASIRQLDAEVQEAVLDKFDEFVEEADERADFGHVQEDAYVIVDGEMEVFRFDMSFNPDSQGATLLDVEQAGG